MVTATFSAWKRKGEFIHEKQNRPFCQLQSSEVIFSDKKHLVPSSLDDLIFSITNSDTVITCLNMSGNFLLACTAFSVFSKVILNLVLIN